MGDRRHGPIFLILIMSVISGKMLLLISFASLIHIEWFGICLPNFGHFLLNQCLKNIFNCIKFSIFNCIGILNILYVWSKKHQSKYIGICITKEVNKHFTQLLPWQEDSEVSPPIHQSHQANGGQPHLGELCHQVRYGYG